MHMNRLSKNFWKSTFKNFKRMAGQHARGLPDIEFSQVVIHYFNQRTFINTNVWGSNQKTTILDYVFLPQIRMRATLLVWLRILFKPKTKAVQEL